MPNSCGRAFFPTQVTRGLKPTPYQNPKITLGQPTIVIIPEWKEAAAAPKVGREQAAGPVAAGMGSGAATAWPSPTSGAEFQATRCSTQGHCPQAALFPAPDRLAHLRDPPPPPTHTHTHPHTHTPTHHTTHTHACCPLPAGARHPPVHGARAAGRPRCAGPGLELPQQAQLHRRMHTGVGVGASAAHPQLLSASDGWRCCLRGCW
jgi:hypothetical protein